MSHGLLDFLRTDIPKEELQTALKVLRAFKACESQGEYLAIPFAAWAKFEQFEDYLKLLTGDGADEVDDEISKAFFKDGTLPETGLY